MLGCTLKQAQWAVTHAQVVANGEIAGAPATAANLADLLSLDADDAAEASATASSAVTALQDLLSGDLSAEVAAAGNLAWIFTSCGRPAISVQDELVLDTAAPETEPCHQSCMLARQASWQL